MSDSRRCVACKVVKPRSAYRSLGASERTGARCKECINAARREAYKASDRYHRQMIESQRRRLYGLSPGAYAALVAAQGGGCAICGQELPKRGAHVDHDHDTGVVRGVLCPRCNGVVLPVVERTPELVARAAAYLRRPTARYVV